jgi:serine/threonine protein kinase
MIGNYSLQKAIGEGTFGKVHLGIHLITGEKVKS